MKVVRFRASPQFKANVKRLPLMAQTAAGKAVLAVAWMIHNDAKTLCRVLTGRCRASVSVNWTGSGMARGKVTGKVAPKPGVKPSSPADGVGQPPKEGLTGFSAVVGTNVDYAEKLENIYPFLWPAFRMNEAKYEPMLAAALKMELKKL